MITNQYYYVRVCCANIRGYGPYCLSHPAYLAPSCKFRLLLIILYCYFILDVFFFEDWREGPLSLDKQLNQIRKLKDLINLVNESKLNGEFVMHDGLIWVLFFYWVKEFYFKFSIILINRSKQYAKVFKAKKYSKKKPQNSLCHGVIV